jgi:hypothetical protein
MMRLQATGQEYAKLPVAADLPLTEPLLVAVLHAATSPDEATVWRPAEWMDTDPALERWLRVLVAGYRMVEPRPDAVILRRGPHRLWVVAAGTPPERIVRAAPGLILVYG